MGIYTLAPRVSSEKPALWHLECGPQRHRLMRSLLILCSYSWHINIRDYQPQFSVTDCGKEADYVVETSHP
jgi:hypothetical protein